METRELKSECERRDAVPRMRQLWNDADAGEIVEWTGEDDYALFGRFDGDELVGLAGVLLQNHLHHADHAWLYDLVVDEPRRGEGHGTALIERVEKWRRERGCEYVSLASPLSGETVHDYYEGRGFEKWGYVIEKEL